MKNILFFVLLSLVHPVQAYYETVTGDTPAYLCAYDYPVGASMLSSVDDWSPDLWGNLEAKTWSPDYAGLSVEENGDVVVRFQFSQSDIDTLNRYFNSGSARVPFAIEIDVVDSDNVLGDPAEEDYVGWASQSLGGASNLGIFLDTPVTDSVHQMSVVITHPERISPNKLHQITFRPDNVQSSSGKFHFVFQLSVNYKWIAMMDNGYSEVCDYVGFVEGTTNLPHAGGYSLVSGGSYGRAGSPSQHAPQ